MAARTLTYTINMQKPPQATHIGLNVIPFDFNSGATKLGTISDMVLLGKVPNGALVTSADIQFGANASAASTWTMLLLITDANGTFSTFATLPALTSITSAAAVAQFRCMTPTKISFSDDRAVQHLVFALNCTVGLTETVSFSFKGNLQYLTDGSNV